MPKNRTDVSYTRVKFIGGTPQQKISRFSMGDSHEKFEYAVSLVALSKADIKHDALEAARIAANKVVDEKLGATGYFLQICVYPHQIIREHKLMGFAGADRLSEGMRHSFGKASGRAARVKVDQKVLTIHVNKDQIEVAKTALKRATSKLPIPYKITVEQLNQTV